MSSHPATRTPAEERAIAAAIAILEKRLAQAEKRYTIGSTHDLDAWARLKLGELDHEVFVVAFLDSVHRVIAVEHLALGTLNTCHVYPREVARAALRHNAAAVVLVHNHPSGEAEFSLADEALTERLREALDLVDVKVLDHLVIAGAKTKSYESIRFRARFRAELLQESEEERTRRTEMRDRQSAAMKAVWARRRAAGVCP